MKPSEIARLRLHHQHIAGSRFEQAAEVVAWLGAVQAQDYAQSLWAVGLRMRSAVEADIERALAERAIIRTWPMRGTLHFVAAADVWWMLELLTPRIVANHARRLQQEYGLDEAVFTRSSEVFVRALQGGKQLTREAMYQALEDAGISTAGQRGLHILWRLAHERLICCAARAGKQQTFALLEEWVPRAKPIPRDEALAELARRYFTGHGPATLQDFAWWSGLTMMDAKAGLEMAKQFLVPEASEGQNYWLAASMPALKDASLAAYLLPVYDEYTVAYKDRSAVLNPAFAQQANAGHGIFNPTLIVGGQVIGTWKRTLKKNAVIVTPSPFVALQRTDQRVVAQAAERYGQFLRLPVVYEEKNDSQ
ncbi:MAG: winged helix DNA-binding domain-containing protein [Blastocatellia bacterium]